MDQGQKMIAAFTALKKLMDQNNGRFRIAVYANGQIRLEEYSLTRMDWPEAMKEDRRMTPEIMDLLNKAEVFKSY